MATYANDWAPSRVTEESLTDLVNQGWLPSKDAIGWRVPGNECPPTPAEGEVIVFVDHLYRGFSPPGSKFFRDALKEDGTEFNSADLKTLTRELRPLATQLAEDTDLTRYQPEYNSAKEKQPIKKHEPAPLDPPARVKTFAPEIESAELIDDEASFKALRGIDWSTPDFQLLKEKTPEEEAEDVPE